MDLEFLEKLVGVAGLGGLCIGIMFLLFRNALSSRYLSRISSERSYQIFKTVLWLGWSMAVLGLVSWSVLSVLSKEAAPSGVVPAPTVMAQVPAAELRRPQPVLTRHQVELRIPDPNVEMVAEIDLEYVEVSGLADANIERKVNARIKEEMGIQVSYSGEEDRFIRLDKAEIHGDLLSIVASGTMLHHLAIGADNVIVSVNLSLTTGDPIEFKDLFRSGYKEEVNRLALQWLTEKSIDHSFEGVSDDQCFYTDGTYLYLCYSEYVIAPGAEGAIAIPLKLDRLRALITRNGPLAFAI